MNTTAFALSNDFRTIPCPPFTATINGTRVVGVGHGDNRVEHVLPAGVAWREFFIGVAAVVRIMAGATVTGPSVASNPFDGMA